MRTGERMSIITGTLYIEFDTDKTITKEQFSSFKRKIELMVESNWELGVCEVAQLSGFESESLHSISLDDLGCDYGEDEDEDEVKE